MREPRRALWAGVALVIYGVQLFALLYGILWHVGRPLAGLIPHPDYPTELPLIAATTSWEAERHRSELGWQLRLHEVNGTPVCDPDHASRCGVAFARSLVDTTPGARNTFVISAAGAAPREVTLTAGPGDATVVIRWAWQGLALAGLGLVYMAIGLLVWLKRPSDPAALPLLLFAVALSGLLGGVLYVDTLTLALSGVLFPLGALTMPMMFLLGHSFATQQDASRSLRFRLQLAAALVVGIGHGVAYILAMRGHAGARALTEWVPGLLVAGAVVALSLTLHSSWRASRPPSPLAHRRRARVFGLAIAVGFSFPTAWLMFEDVLRNAGLDEVAFWGMMVSFAAFPSLIGYAIVQHRMFDLRIVIRQGLLYTILSLGLTLAYVLLVLAAYRLVGVERSALASAGAAAVVAVLAGVARVRVERWIDAMVFRTRAVFRDAVETAGQGLARARKPADIAPALMHPLIESLALSRAYVCDVEQDYERLRFFCVANLEDPESGRVPPALDGATATSSYQPLAAALASGEPVLSSQVRHGVSSFWETFGIEAILPFGLRRGRARGLLVLGPKRNGRPFDREDLALLKVLGGQVALALENAHAFKRLAESNRAVLALTQGIVHEVNTPLGALDASLDTLRRAFERLAETEDGLTQERILQTTAQVVRNAQASGSRLRALIGDLKAYINLEETERRPVDLRACMHELVNERRQRTTAPIRCNLGQEPAWVDGFPAKLRHVLANLLDNALVADTEGHGVDVDLTRERDTWALSIRDRGQGMSEAVLAHVFEFGIAEKRSENRMGLRVGLPYAKRVAEELGGHIGIRSRLGRGTEVRLQLPAHVANHPAPGEAPGSVAAGGEAPDPIQGDAASAQPLSPRERAPDAPRR